MEGFLTAKYSRCSVEPERNYERPVRRSPVESVDYVNVNILISV